MEFEEAMMARAAAQGNKEAQRWLDELDERERARRAADEDDEEGRAVLARDS
jgi:hypothetical protein